MVLSQNAALIDRPLPALDLQRAFDPSTLQLEARAQREKQTNAASEVDDSRCDCWFRLSIQCFQSSMTMITL